MRTTWLDSGTLWGEGGTFRHECKVPRPRCGSALLVMHLRQEDCELGDGLGYLVRPVSKGVCVCVLGGFLNIWISLISRLITWSWITNRGSHSWGKLFLWLSAIISCPWLFVYGWGPVRLTPSLATCLLTLYLFRSCLGSHIVEVPRVKHFYHF